MALDKYHLTHNKKDNWRLDKEGSDRATRVFDTKGEATKGGALKYDPGGENVSQISRPEELPGLTLRPPDHAGAAT